MRFSVSLLLLLAFSLNTVFAQGLSKKCIGEIQSIAQENNFDLKEFLKELPVTVTKVKAQAKASDTPVLGLFLGPGSDDKKTDIGLTIGCIKTFPEKTGDIKNIVKDVETLIKNSITNKGKENVSNRSTERNKASAQKASAPRLKNCEDMFNPANRFCYDGVIYDLCDGMKYDPTVYYCDSPIIRVAKCNGTAYNPLKQRCQNNIIEAKCGDDWYNYTDVNLRCGASDILETKCGNSWYNAADKNSRCQNNVLEAKCGNNWYNGANSRCGTGNVIETKCGTDWYNAANTNFRCQSNVVETKCGADWHNVANMNFRCQNNVIETKCGTEWYNFAVLPNNRCNNDIYETKCGTGWYNTANTNFRCQDNIVETKCGADWHNVANTNFRCQNNVIETKCGYSWYNSLDTNFICRNNVLGARCGTNSYNTTIQFCDVRNNKVYKYVKIGTQIWMAENLNYEVATSKCYDNDPANCETYGRLYNFTWAITVCPSGWHLPSNSEWNVLHHYAGGSNDLAGRYLKASNGWSSGNGEDKYGFAALPGGSGDADGEFGGDGEFGIWWSSTENGTANAYSRSMGYSHESTDLGSNHKSSLLSVRCIQN